MLLVALRSEEHTSELQSRSDLVCRIIRSEEHTSELQSRSDLVCRLLLEKKKQATAEVATAPLYCTRHSTTPPRVAVRTRLSPLEMNREQRISSSFPSPILFFFNDTAAPEIYTLSLPDALPI